MQELTTDEKVLLEVIKTELQGACAIAVYDYEEETARSLIEKGFLLQDFSPSNRCMMVMLPDDEFDRSINVLGSESIQMTEVSSPDMVTITCAEYNQLLRHKEKYINLDELRGMDL